VSTTVITTLTSDAIRRHLTDSSFTKITTINGRVGPGVIFVNVNVWPFEHENSNRN